ncbi:E3 ubiquitin-protein ligase bre1 [Penicillium taxi]|uniref:E3 ubiquitin-protein ligase bre1 n=1 Tax=Penicillium taxi TaxID=168475 RepID=UPI002545AD96|nr:E3 ubiquitin-protein ligase bre1 [Penicillium taxi]KAJ5902540.1 E3 ubiquitin-protein ligase bre1 [Penicillium taxi]
MPAAEPPVLSTESGLVTMDDRKRPASESNDTAPPLKKQATAVNSATKPHPDTDMPWKEDLDRFQKDAILRQMQEYKRNVATLESRLGQVCHESVAHRQRLHFMDSWFYQLIDEVKLLLGPSQEPIKENTFKSSLWFEGVEDFEQYLTSRTAEVREIINFIQSQSANMSPDVTELQTKLAKKLAEEKVAITEYEKTLREKQQLEESLETASLRYMVAEKKLDRAKSLTVAKLEKQHIMGGGQRPGAEGSQTPREDKSSANGGAPAADVSELQAINSQITAVSEKHKEQVKQLEAENASLLGQITELKIKHSKFTDDDYAQTDLFKQLRSQHDDVVKRINHLEAKNNQLQEESGKLRAERIAYKTQIEEEAQSTIAEKENLLMKLETDLVRIRNARDELMADKDLRKAQSQEKTVEAKLQEIADAREARIAALESQTQRLQLQIESSAGSETVDDLPLEELRSKYSTLQRQYDMLNNELNSMQTAYKKFSTVASQKVTHFGALEEKVGQLTVEKTKAVHNYFLAAKARDEVQVEVRTLRMQNSQASNIVSQLKESESATRIMLSTMDKQNSELKEALNSCIEKQRMAQQQLTESNIRQEGLKGQVAELKALSSSKDEKLGTTSSALREAETEIVSLKQSLSDMKKSLENWKGKSLGNSSSEYEMLRSLALCGVCCRRWKNTVIKICGHVFCRECVDERLSSRSRKCPNCGLSFGVKDHMHITL